MSHASADMQAYYAARATYYDAVYERPERRQDIAFLCSHLPAFFSGRRVLEIACGTGFWTQHIAPAAHSMMATDGTAEPLELARLRPGTANVLFEQMDAYELPPTLGELDAAFAGLWFSHVPLQARSSFLQGLHAHLQPGARVSFLDNNEVQLRDFPITQRDADGNTYQQRQLRDGSTHLVLKNFPSAAELQSLLEPMACDIRYRNLENFWLLEYVLDANARR